MRTRPTPSATLSAVLCVACALAWGAHAHAAIERVVIHNGGKEDAVIERADGGRWRLDLRQSCQPMLGVSGRQALLFTSDGVLGPGARLLMPELDLDCPVFAADSIGHVKRRPAPEAPDDGLHAVRAALEQLGHPCGPLEPNWNDDAAQAFVWFREAHHLDSTPTGVHRALLALAIEVLGGRQPTGTALQLSQAIDDQIDVLTTWLTRATDVCGAETFVRSVDEPHTAVKLGDGTVWQLDAAEFHDVAGWPPNDVVLACSGRLVDTRTGAMVHATHVP